MVDTGNQGAPGTEKKRRSPLLRLLFGFFWFIPIYLVSNTLIGAIVGAIAGAKTTSYEEGYAAGRIAATEFFEAYGLIVLLCQILATIVLSVAGVLPGTGKYTKKHPT